MALKQCGHCGSTIVFGGTSEGENHFCGQICLENFKFPGFCQECISQTTDESPGGTTTINGVGTKLYGNAKKCPTCFSVIKKKWFCFIFIPVIPLGKYRIKQISTSQYYGRLIPS